MKLYKDDYEFIYRDDAFENVNQDKEYDKCYAQDFVAYINTLGDVHSCINYIDDKEYEYGNIYENKFRDIWENKQMIKPDLDKCRTICRIDNCNRYLHRLKNPDKHENFI